VDTAEILLDTDVLIDHLRGAVRLSTGGLRPAVSVISRYELFAARDEHERLRRFLWSMIELGIDGQVAELAGTGRRQTGIPTPDALIAATALVHRIPLMTRNSRHFDRVAELRVVAPG
jgi:predicted nucleic acid-binding protein